MEEDEAASPIDVSGLGANGAVPNANRLPHLVEQARLVWLRQ
jgi:hypothetical protein